ncbi:MAG: acyltransferase family protein [Spirochaetota bacterium]
MKYRQDIELFRILSAFGIVWFHSHLKGADIGYSGLVFFIILSVYLSGDGHNVIQRLKSLLLPWLSWSLFYGFVNFIIDKPFIDTDNGFITGLLAGSKIHLWYLPFMFFILILFDLIKKNSTVLKIGYSAVCIALISLLSVFLWRDFTNALGAPWAQYSHALPAVFVGAYFWAFNKLTSIFQFHKFIMLLFLLAAVININITGVGISYTIGILMFFPIIFFPPWLNFNFNIRNISELTLGIYLLHPFIYMVFFKFNVNLGYFLPLAVFITCSILIWITKNFFPKLSKYII